jgi:hypothetical protein
LPKPFGANAMPVGGQTGRFDDAVKWQKKAYELAQAEQPERLNALEGMKESLALYEKHQPNRETPIVISPH